MDFLNAIFLGILQGLTEFLPVSSDGHLFLAEVFLGLTPDLHFELSLHVASLFAIIIVYRRRLWEIFRGTCRVCHISMYGNRDEGILGLKLIIATIATVPIAMIVQQYFHVLRSVETISITLLITGALILFAEHFRPMKEKAFSWPIALTLGFLQGFAIIPGISRSGLTIAILILLGIHRKKAAEISFLLAIPTILGALVYSLIESPISTVLTAQQLWACLFSFIAAIFAIHWMIRLVEKRWVWFAPYCFALGALLLML